ncbi:hypothetical protein KO465_07560 [Candidatus Micrarchaeota archaeon]|nr:hypothetical protein [Candidatus Micrarchaeota archaeon]
MTYSDWLKFYQFMIAFPDKQPQALLLVLKAPPFNIETWAEAFDAD